MEDAGLMRSLVSTFVLFVVIVVIAVPVAVTRLRDQHRAVWEAMGSPSVIPSPFKASTWHLAAFIMSMKHTRLDDLTLSLACVAAALGVLAALLGLVGLILLRMSGG
jgi:hypothetical protein